MAKIDFFASLILGPYYLKIMGVTFSDPPPLYGGAFTLQALQAWLDACV